MLPVSYWLWYCSEWSGRYSAVMVDQFFLMSEFHYNRLLKYIFVSDLSFDLSFNKFVSIISTYTSYTDKKFFFSEHTLQQQQQQRQKTTTTITNERKLITWITTRVIFIIQNLYRSFPKFCWRSTEFEQKYSRKLVSGSDS